jgi:5'-nucleotidase
MRLMRILITNDDGIRAPGLKALVEVASRFGVVKIVAPDYERSACGHGMTLRDPLRCKPVDWNGLDALEVDGLPVDCVNVGLSLLWPDGCDLVLSGFNNGPNLGFDITYSGTAAGAMEGCINGIPSISLSMAILASGAPFHWETGIAWTVENWELLMNLPHREGVFYNVNIPALALPEIQGHKFARMGQRVYKDRVMERLDPWGKPYYWQGSAEVLNEHLPGTDVEAVRQGFVAITPIRLDWTADEVLEELRAPSSSPATQI